MPMRKTRWCPSAPSSPIPPELAREPMLNEILQEIRASKDTSTTLINSKTEEIKLDISIIKQDFQKLRERTTAVEQRVSDLEEACDPIPERPQELQRQAANTAANTNDLENRLRRNNIRLVGFRRRQKETSRSSSWRHGGRRFFV